MRTAALMASQPQPSSRARCATVWPPAICLATHLAARVLSRHPTAAIRWSPRVKERCGHTRVGADEPVLLPAQRDGHAAEGQVDVGDDRAVLDPGPAPTARTPQRRIGLLDGDLARRTTARVGQDADVFETNEVSDDLVRIEVHRGVERFLFHTLRLKRLCAYAVDPR